jgi:coenzyme F420 hydrogenase subunit beta
MNFLEIQRKVIETGLCTSCGTCIGICPISIIGFDEHTKPKINDDCNNCGLCTELCPAYEFDFKFFENFIYDNEIVVNELIGGYKKLFVGYTKFKEVREKASGGGIITSLLISALDKGLIDGAIVVKMDDENPISPKPFIARNGEEILEAAQSKYILTPINSILKILRNERGRFAFVGLPCQVHAIRKIQMKSLKKYTRKIEFVIGLFCGINMRNDFVDYMLSIQNIKKPAIEKIQFRSREYENSSSVGGFMVITRDGKKHYIDKSKYQGLKYIFANTGCLYCLDHTNEFADISIGDMWLPKYLKKGEPLQSTIIIRTKKGMELFEWNSEILNYFPLEAEDIIKCQLALIVEKQIRGHTRILLRKERDLYIPDYNREIISKEYLLPRYNLKIDPARAFSRRNRITESFWLRMLHITDKKFSVNFLSKIHPKILRVFVSQFIRFRERDGIISQTN